MVDSGVATVDHDRLSSQVTGGRRAEQGDWAFEIRGLTHPARRDQPAPLLGQRGVRLGELPGHVREDVAGRHGVHPDPERGPLHGQRFGHHVHAGFGGVIADLVLRDVDHRRGHRRDVHDRAAVTGVPAGPPEGLAGQVRPGQVHVDHLRPGGLGALQAVLPDGDPGRIDQDGGRAQLPADLGEGSGQVLLAGHVHASPRVFTPVAARVSALSVTPAQHVQQCDVDAQSGQGAGQRETDTSGSAGDHSDLAVEILKHAKGPLELENLMLHSASFTQSWQPTRASHSATEPQPAAPRRLAQPAWMSVLMSMFRV